MCLYHPLYVFLLYLESVLHLFLFKSTHLSIMESWALINTIMTLKNLSYRRGRTGGRPSGQIYTHLAENIVQLDIHRLQTGEWVQLLKVLLAATCFIIQNTLTAPHIPCYLCLLSLINVCPLWFISNIQTLQSHNKQTIIHSNNTRTLDLKNCPIMLWNYKEQEWEISYTFFVTVYIISV